MRVVGKAQGQGHASISTGDGEVFVANIRACPVIIGIDDGVAAGACVLIALCVGFDCWCAGAVEYVAIIHVLWEKASGESRLGIATEFFGRVPSIVIHSIHFEGET